ncbi:unnamed protein product [Citrullus colocynthis]|uniref:Uncharacterized protein n=1 Tax=Citrullus colocynthis TaxID=252529 RepID=A0ABP0YLG4_9ROSI
MIITPLRNDRFPSSITEQQHAWSQFLPPNQENPLVKHEYLRPYAQRNISQGINISQGFIHFFPFLSVAEAPIMLWPSVSESDPSLCSEAFHLSLSFSLI